MNNNDNKQRNNMKTNITSIIATLLLTAAVSLRADEAPKQKIGSPEFERLKTLAGTWEGKTDMGQGPIDLKIHYRVLAGGSVIEEKCFAGTPNEMTTMYYDRDGKLSMTHYCMLGNRPGMLLKSADAKTLHFDFDKSCGIDPVKEAHMHSLKITFDDSDTITTSCKAIMDGKEMPEKPTTLKRVKAT
jgi:hypothetical protein